MSRIDANAHMESTQHALFMRSSSENAQVKLMSMRDFCLQTYCRKTHFSNISHQKIPSQR